MEKIFGIKCNEETEQRKRDKENIQHLTPKYLKPQLGAQAKSGAGRSSSCSFVVFDFCLRRSAGVVPICDTRNLRFRDRASRVDSSLAKSGETR
jgi:hypothetical protein